MIRVAINGFGRIGRTFTRVIENHPEIQIVGINDLADIHNLAHLLKYDSIHKQFPSSIKVEGNKLVVGKNLITITSKKEPENLPWKELNVDFVIESTGKFRSRSEAMAHIKAGAKKVIISAPAKDDDIKSICIGVNDHILNGDEEIISNASCTTNSAAPMIQLLDELCKVQSGYITTVHSYTSDQRLQDAPHADYRRGRAAALSIVPTTTGAAKAITKIFPHLENKMGGCGLRVPVPDGSITDITAIVENPLSEKEINQAFKKASENRYKGILEYTEDPIVSSDIIGNSHSCIFDSDLTSVVGNMVKIMGWYDNEMGYSNRLAELIIKMNQLSKRG